ncbi:hypothetical protein BV20DRAFT_231280 [Pilatotrama ljubarskyi]|nr:hypothetical protein BV20DRAFT_231280 [Pilatotrama ljubarskyi]
METRFARLIRARPTSVRSTPLRAPGLPVDCTHALGFSTARVFVCSLSRVWHGEDLRAKWWTWQTIAALWVEYGASSVNGEVARVRKSCRMVARCPCSCLDARILRVAGVFVTKPVLFLGASASRYPGPSPPHRASWTSRGHHGASAPPQDLPEDGFEHSTGSRCSRSGGAMDGCVWVCECECCAHARDAWYRAFWPSCAVRRRSHWAGASMASPNSEALNLITTLDRTCSVRPTRAQTAARPIYPRPPLAQPPLLRPWWSSPSTTSRSRPRLRA